MTPQESQLVDELFDRLASLETVPRDPDAERLIADGTRRAPHAVYALVQTTLLQDEALKRANARIEELQAQLDEAPPAPQRQGSFLDSMREAFGAGAPRGSVPSVRAPNAPTSGYQSQNFQGGYPPPPPGYAAGPAFGSGGSFLGTAASTAAGFIGGALLLDGIRSMLGHRAGGYAPSSVGDFGDRGSPWAGTASDSQLARDAGINDIGQHAHHGGGDRVASADDTSQSADDGSPTDGDDYSDDSDLDSDFSGDFGGGDSSDV